MCTQSVIIMCRKKTHESQRAHSQTWTFSVCFVYHYDDIRACDIHTEQKPHSTNSARRRESRSRGAQSKRLATVGTEHRCGTVGRPCVRSQPVNCVWWLCISWRVRVVNRLYIHIHTKKRVLRIVRVFLFGVFFVCARSIATFTRVHIAHTCI